MRILQFFAVLVALGVGIYVGIFVLPFQYSPQNNLDLTQLTGLYNPDAKYGIFHNQTSISVYIPPKIAKNRENVLGAYRSDKRIEVDLTNQRLYAFEGNTKVYDFLISSGKWGKTPTGEFNIWIKLRYTKMSGGNQALGTYYNLPNVPFTMFFANNEVPTWKGFGIHGTYWHNNFGHPMSHGCVNMKTEEVEQLYYWAQPDLPEGLSSVRSSDQNPGTKVIIYGQAPNE
jgi:lipoprotein-anchoring transpeptidase ErfK/SrfK